MIRKASEADLPYILEIYDRAKEFMHGNGNPHQWVGVYPGEDILREDIRKDQLHVVVRDGRIRGVFVFFIGEEPTYRVVYGGEWKYSGSYGVIHRIASDREVKGVGRECFDYALSMAECLRIDTHRDNLPMQGALKKYGFEYRGGIKLENGDDRMAFEFIK